MESKEKTIKTLLKELFAISKREEKYDFKVTHKNFTDAKSIDGSILRTPDATIVAGSKLTIIGTDGTEVPAPVTDYTCEDGSIISVKTEGIVDSITPAPAVADAPVAVATTDATPAPAPVDNMAAAPISGDTAQDVMALAPNKNEDVFTADDAKALMETIKNLTDRIAAIEEKVHNTNMTVQKMGAMPGAEPINKSAIKSILPAGLELMRADYKKKELASQNNFDKVSNIKVQFSKETPSVKKDETKKFVLPKGFKLF